MPYTAIVITVSDRASRGEYADLSGPAVSDMLSENGYTVTELIIVPDEKIKIIEALLSSAGKGADLIVTTGGTGFAPRDVTPEATLAVIERECPGITEYMRMKSAEITPRAILSRGVAGIRDKSMIINLPGSPKAAAENLSFILPHLSHGLDMLNGNKE